MTFVQEELRKGAEEILDLPWSVNNTGRIIVYYDTWYAVLMQRHTVYDMDGNVVEEKVDPDDKMDYEFELWVYDSGTDQIIYKCEIPRELATDIVNKMYSYISDRYKID